MHDRITDRAAPHATPASLEIRDGLLVALSFATGVYEAICFLAFGKVFTAAMTGNLVLLGIGAAGTRAPAGPNAVTVIISLAAFAAGAALAMPILRAFNGDEEVADKDNDIFHVWPRRVSIALAAALIPQIAFLALWDTTATPATPATPATLAYPLIALSALGMGLQMNAVRSLHVPGVSTTAFTAGYISLISGLTTLAITAQSAWRLTGTLFCMAAGAFLGDWMLSHAHPYAPLVPLLVTAAVIAVAWLALNPRTRSGPPGEQGMPAQHAARP